MYLMVTVLEQTKYLSDILEGFAKIGITGSTVIDSTGMGRVLMKTQASSTFAQHITKVITDLESSNKTIITVVKDKDILDQAIGIVKSFVGNLYEPGKGILFVCRLEIVEGLPEADGIAHS